MRLCLNRADADIGVQRPGRRRRDAGRLLRASQRHGGPAAASTAGPRSCSRHRRTCSRRRFSRCRARCSARRGRVPSRARPAANGRSRGPSAALPPASAGGKREAEHGGGTSMSLKDRLANAGHGGRAGIRRADRGRFFDSRRRRAAEPARERASDARRPDRAASRDRSRRRPVRRFGEGASRGSRAIHSPSSRRGSSRGHQQGRRTALRHGDRRRSDGARSGDRRARLRADRTPLTRDEQGRLVKEITDDILGYGALEPFLADSVTEIMMNRFDQIYIERAGRSRRRRRRSSTTPTYSG